MLPWPLRWYSQAPLLRSARACLSKLPRLRWLSKAVHVERSRGRRGCTCTVGSQWPGNVKPCIRCRGCTRCVRGRCNVIATCLGTAAAASAHPRLTGGPSALAGIPRLAQFGPLPLYVSRPLSRTARRAWDTSRAASIFDRAHCIHLLRHLRRCQRSVEGLEMHGDRHGRVLSGRVAARELHRGRREVDAAPPARVSPPRTVHVHKIRRAAAHPAGQVIHVLCVT